MSNKSLFSEKDDFILNIEGFEGPIELLLDLAKNQKVDLKYISILELADQYSEFVKKEIKTKNLTLVADFLVIAAWLTYLKSRLLLPDQKDEEIPAHTLAENLKEQLLKLEEMRNAGLKIFSRPQLNKDFYKKGSTNNTLIKNNYVFDCTLYDLLRNIVSINAKKEANNYKINLKKIHTVDEALKSLKTFFETNKTDWVLLDSFIQSNNEELFVKKSNKAAHFAASLELVKEGLIQLRQHAPFAPIYIKNIYKEK